MYEMEGPCRRRRASEPMTRRPVRRLADHRILVPARGRRLPSSSGVPRVAPGTWPVFGGDKCSTATTGASTRPLAN